MPRDRPPTTGYERLAQADQFSDDSDDDLLAASSASLQPASAPRFAAITQPRHRSGMMSPKANQRPKLRRRGGSHGGVDLKAINARLERWADEIASRFKRGKGRGISGEEERLEIHHSVFQPPEGVRPVTAEGLAEDQPGVMTKAEFEAIVESVRLAIRQEVHPSMISQGSSGSYFARNPDGKIVGVFKPKDEEPYAAGNPKWNKWIHRNLFPCCFGRAWYVLNLHHMNLWLQLTNPSPAVLFPICRMSVRRQPTYSTANSAPTSFPTQMLSGYRQNHSTTLSGTVAASIERRSRCLQSLVVFKSSSRASKMQTFFCGSTPGQTNIGPASGQTIRIGVAGRDGQKAAVHLHLGHRKMPIPATKNRQRMLTGPPVRRGLRGRSKLSSLSGRNLRSLSSWTIS